MQGTFPLEFGTLHFVGIGGIGMSGIAEVLLNMGYSVQGSDIAENANVKRLRRLGAEVRIGQRAENVEGVAAIVVSTAIKPDNPEVVAARELNIPVVHRSEMLAELMRLKWSIAVAGTHGKTTTTSIIAALMDACDFDPTVINGGVITAYGSTAKLGESDLMVVEADESDGSFLKLQAAVAVVTNVDPEHMESYGSVKKLHDAFLQFVEAIPFYGFAVMCLDHPVVQQLSSKVSNRTVLTYGFSPQADARIMNARSQNGGTCFDLAFARPGDTERDIWEGLVLPMAGEHNISNATAAIVVARQLGGSQTQIREALSGFKGVKRRFTHVGDWNGARIIDDYGHHPVEIAAVLQAARQSTQNKVIAVMQPHRYSRLHDLFDGFCTCMNDADTVYVADVYEAGETPIEGVDRDHLVTGLRAAGHRDAHPVTREDLAKTLKDKIEPGDLVVFLGAGSITYWANDVQSELEALG